MKTIILIIGSVLISEFSFTQSYSVSIVANGFPSSEGVAVIRIYNQENGFPKDETKAYKVVKSTITNKQCNTMVDLPIDNYAFVIFHDKNSNGKIDKNWTGMPVESLGLSNYEKMGKPSYEKAKVLVKSDTTVEVNVQSMF